MAGLLNNFFGSPEQTQALGLLGVGMMNGGFGQGAGLAMQHLAGADERKTRKGLLDAQLQETLAQAEERKQRMELARLAQERQNALLFGTQGMPGAAPGAGAPAADGAPMGASAPAGGGGGLIAFARSQGIPEQAIHADIAFNGGKKIAELLADRAKPNWQNVNGNLVNTAAPGFQGGFQPGVNVSNDGKATMWQPDGQGGLVVGAPRGAIDTYRAYQGVGERAKADFDPVQVVGPDGAARFVPRSQVVAPQPAAAGNADADRYAILTQELAKAKASGNVRDVAALEAEISRLSPAARTAPSPSGLAVAGGYQATPTSAQAAAAAAAKTKAEADARAASERDAGRAKKGDSANEMLRSIGRAKTLLDLDPTGSLGGAAMDKAIGAFGMTTPGGNVANSLETLSGWLVANVPRMEGPQSNFDVENYRVMAGRIGDRTIPIEARKAALAEVERIQQKYAGINADGGQEPQKANLVNELPKVAARGTRARDTTTGKVMVFNGMSWVPEK
jgi:hypothetical protein